MWNTCRELQEYIVDVRRRLHRIPELGVSLPETVALVKSELDAMGIPCRVIEGDRGIVALIGGKKDGKTLALRADMDALLITEETGLPFASCREGKMHACGHDAHTAMLLGAAKALKANEDHLCGTVKLLFQTGEEDCTGAKVLLEEGALDDVNAVFGTHIGTLFGKDIPSGTMIVPNGCCMASFDKFILRIRGKGCHGSSPEKGVDPINIAAHTVLNLQAITTREISAVDSLVLTIGKIEGGSQYNIIPDEVTIVGTTRTLKESIRQYAARRIGEIASATAAVFGGSAELEMVWGAPPVTNDAELAALAASCAKKVFGESHVITDIPAPNMGGEDFAFYQQKLGGVYMFLSSANSAKGTDVPHHNPHFDVDEDVLWQGAALFTAIAEDYLNN